VTTAALIIADAAASADAGPLWLRISIALGPPALAAIIAGYFALSNTVNRRAERLKNLNEVRASYPELINPNYALERIILRELGALARATTPAYKFQRRFYLVGLPLVTVLWACNAVMWLKLVNFPDTEKSIVNLIITGLFVAVSVPAVINLFVLKKTQRIDEGYDRAFAALDERAVQAQTLPGEGELQVGPESVSGTDQQPIRPIQPVGSVFVSRLSHLTACVWLCVMVVRLIAAARRTLVGGERRRP
jgi:hypothetical protein